MDDARKNDSEKARFALIPATPLYELAELFTKGAALYGDRNWEKGLRWGRVFAALMRHAWKWWRGEEFDKEDGQHHMIACAWCALVLREYTHTGKGKDDRPK